MASSISYIVALALVVNAASALQCYKCNSQDNVSCRFGITSFIYDTETCNSAGVLDSVIGPKCYRITAKNREGQEYIARGCQNPPAFGCEMIAKSAGWISAHTSSDPGALSDLECTTCDTDKCNSASKLAGYTIVGVLVAVFAFIF